MGMETITIYHTLSRVENNEISVKDAYNIIMDLPIIVNNHENILNEKDFIIKEKDEVIYTQVKMIEYWIEKYNKKSQE
jgi:hypothetical protein